MNITPKYSPGSGVRVLPKGWRLEIPAGDASSYRFAQLDDYPNLPRKKFPLRPPLTMRLRARVSSDFIPGTWGFGLWNDPFGISLGFGGNPLRLPSLPNAIWFFHASEENWLSFSEKPGNGFLAQVFRSPKIYSTLAALMGLPILPILATRSTRKWLRKIVTWIIKEDGVQLDLDTTAWHDYRLNWQSSLASFWVDDLLVMKSSVNPSPPLGLVLWLDNQYAAFTPDGRAGYGVLGNEAAWLEIEDLHVE